MAEFRMVGERRIGVKPLTVRKNNVVELNPKATKLLYLAQAEVEIISRGRFLPHRYVSTRDTIEAPDGAQLLPYFWAGDEWIVVLVEQFRIAIPGQTYEAPGGEVDERDPAAAMARELSEETGIKIDHKAVEIVFCERIQPSMMAARIWGGIVRINPADLPPELLNGEVAFGDYTVLITKPLEELLVKRDTLTADFDLMLSRLLDEVAKRVGLLQKHY